jgi:hypothetical protein
VAITCRFPRTAIPCARVSLFSASGWRAFTRRLVAALWVLGLLSPVGAWPADLSTNSALKTIRSNDEFHNLPRDKISERYPLNIEMRINYCDSEWGNLSYENKDGIG